MNNNDIVRIGVMTIECHYTMCPRHGTHAGEEGPFCYEAECRADEHERMLYAAGLKLRRMGYDLEELERDNPYSGSSI